MAFLQRILRGTTVMFLLLLPGIACGEEATSVKVAEVPKGHVLVLEDGRQVRLVGIRAPEPAEGDDTAEPLWEEAKATLSNLALGKTVSLQFTGTPQDRHGRLLAHVTREGGAWIQGEMLKSGMAYVYSFSDNTARVNEMLALEREARAAKRGIWDNAYYAVIPQEQAGEYLNRFKIIEGTPVSVTLVKGTTYINFGKDWRTDFTLTLDKEARGRFLKAALDPASLAGKPIRVRGWLEYKNGPALELTHPEQVEILNAQ